MKGKPNKVGGLKRIIRLLSLVNQRSFTFFIDVFLYEITIVYVTGFVLFVLVRGVRIFFRKYICLNILEGSLVETLWSLLPLIVLRRVILPSL